MTDGLRQILVPPPGVTLDFYTAPTSAPPSINDVTTGVLSAAACFADVQKEGVTDKYDGFLVCCCTRVFSSADRASLTSRLKISLIVSDHPLTHMLRENTPKPVMNILEAAISQSLLIGQRFGIITSGWGYKYIHYTEVRNFLGATSERFAGLVTCELGVLEFQSGERTHVEARVKAAAAKSASQGADVIILGCAGTNMKGLSR